MARPRGKLRGTATRRTFILPSAAAITSAVPNVPLALRANEVGDFKQTFTLESASRGMSFMRESSLLSSSAPRLSTRCMRSAVERARAYRGNSISNRLRIT